MSRGYPGETETEHAIRRARERYALDLTSDDIVRMSDQIASDVPCAEYIESKTRDISRWRVIIRGLWLDVMFNAETRQVLTVFPRPKHEKRIKWIEFPPQPKDTDRRYHKPVRCGCKGRSCDLVRQQIEAGKDGRVIGVDEIHV